MRTADEYFRDSRWSERFRIGHIRLEPFDWLCCQCQLRFELAVRFVKGERSVGSPNGCTLTRTNVTATLKIVGVVAQTDDKIKNALGERRLRKNASFRHCARWVGATFGRRLHLVECIDI